MTETHLMGQQNFKLGLVQMTSADRREENILMLEVLARDAKAKGCDVLALPEVAGLMERNPERAREQLTSPEDDPWDQACAKVARTYGLWLHSGSSPVLAPSGKFLNRSAVFDPSGTCVASYSKIHLFDVDLDGQRPIRESDRYEAGEAAVLVHTPLGLWGLTICYDLRFPGLFRDYARRGAGVIFVPSAFAVATGRAHWEPLLRARAIENGAWIVAAAQAGTHADGRKTWGHAMVVTPWGEVICDLGTESPALAVVDTDLAAVDLARGQVPSLVNERDYKIVLANRG